MQVHTNGNLVLDGGDCSILTLNTSSHETQAKNNFFFDALMVHTVPYKLPPNSWDSSAAKSLKLPTLASRLLSLGSRSVRLNLGSALFRRHLGSQEVLFIVHAPSSNQHHDHSQEHISSSKYGTSNLTNLQRITFFFSTGMT